MGIRGLSKYISHRSDQFLEYYELHNTYLVIDGNNIIGYISNCYVNYNCAYGGDYNKYAHSIAEFFNCLLKCNIAPLVLFDGGYEDKKFETIISRTTENIRTANHSSSQFRLGSVFPIFLKQIFIEVLKEKGIQYLQCMFEADNSIAAVARTLNCPVLSNDSDFYIYDVLYIPFQTLSNIAYRNRSNGNYFMKCRIYKAEILGRYFQGLDKSILPLAAILFGNDYVKDGTFQNFYDMKLQVEGTPTNYKTRQDLIEATLKWLSRNTLNSAIIEILTTLPKSSRRIVLDVIENVMDNYTRLPTDVIIPLGFPKRYVDQSNAQFRKKLFKFEADINNLTYIDETSHVKDSGINEEEEINDKIAYSALQLDSNEKFIEVLPTWFIDEYYTGHLPKYFVDLLRIGLYICPIQIEDYFYPSTILTCLQIISVISGLLRLSSEERYNHIECVTRESNEIARYPLKRCDSISSSKLPLLGNLREVPLIIRKKILDHTLNITNEFMYDLLPEWALYFATMSYWLQQKKKFELNCHVYSLLLILLFSVIDGKIGSYRRMHIFHLKFDRTIQAIKYERDVIKYNAKHSKEPTILDAYKNVDKTDCLLAAPFFILHCEDNYNAFKIPGKYNVTIVHEFNEFQNCLKHSMDLNALLGYPYPQTKISEVYNGTLLYNFCNNFKKHNNPETYIDSILQQSPTLLQLFRAILTKMKTFITTKNYKQEKIRPEADRSKEENYVKNTEISVPFYDANNPYTLLDTME